MWGGLRTAARSLKAKTPRSVPALSRSVRCTPRVFGAEEPTGPPEYVSLNVVNRSGEKHKIQAQIGESVFMAAFKHRTLIDMPLEESCWGQGVHPDLYGPGPMCDMCHVYIPTEYREMCKSPRILEEEDDILYLNDDSNESSRLSCQIDVKKEMDGMTVVIAPRPAMWVHDEYVPGSL